MECNVPLRNYLGTKLDENFFTDCTLFSFYKIVGLSVTLGVGLLIIHLVTQNSYNKSEPQNKKNILVIPAWSSLLPLAYIAYYYIFKMNYLKMEWESEKLRFETSNRTKADYLNIRDADERQEKASLKGILGTGLLAGSNFFRGYLIGY